MEIKRLPLNVYEQTLFHANKLGYKIPSWYGKVEVDSKVFIKWWNGFMVDVPSDDPISDLLSYYYIHMFSISGSNRYIITDELTSMLLATDYSTILVDALKLPHTSFTIKPGLNLSYEPNGVDGEGEINEIIVCFVKSDTVAILDSQVPAENRIEIQILSHGGDVFFGLKINIRSGGDLLDSLTNDIDHYEIPNPARVKLIKVIKFIISVILYLETESNDAVLIKPKKLFNKDSSYPACVIGSTIKLDKTRYNCQEGGGTFDIKILKWSVSGHFRQQPCGTGRIGTKKIWIEPYFKGVEKDTDIRSKPTNFIV